MASNIAISAATATSSRAKPRCAARSPMVCVIGLTNGEDKRIAVPLCTPHLGIKRTVGSTRVFDDRRATAVRRQDDAVGDPAIYRCNGMGSNDSH